MGIEGGSPTGSGPTREERISHLNALISRRLKEEPPILCTRGVGVYKGPFAEYTGLHPFGGGGGFFNNIHGPATILCGKHVVGAIGRGGEGLRADGRPLPSPYPPLCPAHWLEWRRVHGAALKKGEVNRLKRKGEVG